MPSDPCCKILRGARCWTWVAIFLNTIAGCFYAAYQIINLLNPEFLSESFCQQNRFEKEMRGLEDKIIDGINTSCTSSVVLDYKPEDLGPYLQGQLVLGAIAGSVLAVTGPLAAVGMIRNCRRLLLLWLAAGGLWAGALLITAATLSKFGFGKFVGLLVGAGAISLLLLVPAIRFYRKVPRQIQSYKPGTIPMQDFGENAEEAATDTEGEHEGAMQDAGRPHVASEAV